MLIVVSSLILFNLTKSMELDCVELTAAELTHPPAVFSCVTFDCIEAFVAELMDPPCSMVGVEQNF